MKLESNKIYPTANFTNGTPVPSLFVKGTAQIYVAFDETKPTSVDKMHDVSAEVSEGNNLLQGQIRWIAAKYTDDGTNLVEEAGIVTSNAKRGF